ncbi:unnamed protein product [Brachionus calyciflorus]|uniref:Uncharacterized protein n=1 Tax=Brachionus calyciflorus TaxID=104777 RepID=A0A813LXE6_9BILA|nr:unnamed protein product [Brachionus calyciflorus]
MSFENKLKRKSDKGIKRKSIQLKIDLPLDDSDSDFEQNINCTPRIHLKISIDRNSAKKLHSAQSNRVRKQINFSDKSTSGYSSSSASSSLIESINEYSYLNDFEENLIFEDLCSTSTLKRKRDSNSNENIYDKLIHSNGKISKNRPSITRSTLSPKISKYEFLNENSCESDENIYEEISNFIESNPKAKKFLSPKKFHNYENLKDAKTSLYYNDTGVISLEDNSKKFTYKREYTVNEIFDNLKKFKKQAKEQEILSNSTKKSNKVMYENNTIYKPIYV